MQYVIYYRVSTKKQGDSGLGLEAQRAYIAHYLTADEIAAEFVEVQSGKNVQDRPKLQRAIALCEAQGYALAVAKIDRLSRKTEDALAVYNQLDGRLYSCDIPTQKGAKMDKFTLTIFMAIADRERELIGIRTRQALQVKLERDGYWSESNLDQTARERGAAVNVRQAVRDYQTTIGYVRLLHEAGLSFRGIARRLNREGHTTRNGKQFRHTTVRRMLDRVN